MGLFSNLILDTLDDLLLMHLQDLYAAERRLTEALPRMAEAASNTRLRSVFKEHLGETRRQVARLEKVFVLLGLSTGDETCEAMENLIAEGEAVINADGDADIRDAALIASAQRIEHYEIAGYGSARKFAHQLGHREIAGLLQQTLDEEHSADQKLSKVSELAFIGGAAVA